MTELELKFSLDAAALKRWRTEMEHQGVVPERLQSSYFDTTDGHLARNGISLRLRHETGRWLQTLKIKGEGNIEREEDEVELVHAGNDRPTLDPTRHKRGSARRSLRGALADWDGELVLRFETDVKRYRNEITTADGTHIEVALDVGKVKVLEANGQSDPIHELEFEYKAGPVDGLFNRARESVMAGGLSLSTLAKADRGQRLIDGPVEPLAVKARDVQASADVAGPQFLGTVLLNILAQVLPNASEVAAGASDAEVIHQLRVGLRRLRTALRELRVLCDDIDPEWERPLAEAFTKLGERRDNESVIEAVRPVLAQAGAPKPAWSVPAFTDTAAAVKSATFQATLLQILALAYALREDRGHGSTPRLRKAMKRCLDRLHRKVARDGRRFNELPAERQHRVRKRVKRLRYVAEFVAPLFPAKRLRRYVNAFKPAQEALGTHNDTAVAAQMFREDAVTDSSALFAAGFLQARLQSTGRIANKALRKAIRAKQFW